MTEAVSLGWLVMGGVAVLQLLGSGLAHALLRGRHAGFCLASGLLWGVASHGLLAAVIVLARNAFGALPLYPVGVVATGTLLAALGVLGVCLMYAPRWGGTRAGLLFAHACGALTAGLAAAVTFSFDLSTLTPDSLGMIEAALGLASLHDPAWPGLYFLGARGMLGVLLHAPAGALPIDFLWFASPLLALACFASLAAAATSAIRERGGPPGLAAGTVTLALLWLLGCLFFTWQVFYVHVNLTAGAMLLLFFVSAWRSLVDEDDAWLPLAGLALLAYQMLRVEGSLFAVLFAGGLVLERAAAGRPLRPALWLIVPGATWCAALAAVIDVDDGIVDGPLLLGMAALLLACLPLGWLAGHSRLVGWRDRLPALSLGALALGLLSLVALRPGHMVEHMGILLWNAVGIGSWSTAWALVPAFALAAPLLGRVPHQRFVQLGTAAYFIALLGLTYAGHWRAGWYDSGNRMLTHALPTLVWLGILRTAAIVPPRAARPPVSGAQPGDP